MLKSILKYICCVVCYLITNTISFAQNKDTVVAIIDTTRAKEEKKPMLYFINGNTYRSPNNWFCMGVGPGYKFNSPQKNSTPIAFSYNFHVKGSYMQVGFMRSELNGFFSGRTSVFLNDLHIGVGKRKETLKNNIAGFICVSRATGQLTDTTRFTSYGLYSEIHYIHKLFYDIGVGAALFGSYSKAYQMAGIRLELYFSNALRKEKK